MVLEQQGYTVCCLFHPAGPKMPLNSTDLLEEGDLKEAEFMAKRWSLEQVKNHC